MKKDILQVISGVIILSIIMDILFLAIGKFDMKVLWGTLIGSACAIVNFVLLAFTIYVSISNGKSASGYIGASYLLRVAFIGIAIVFAIKSPHINYVAAAIPLVFPRITITFLQGILKMKRSSGEEGDNFGRS